MKKAVCKEGIVETTQKSVLGKLKKFKGTSFGDKTLFFLSVFVMISLLIYTFTGANLSINSDTATANILAEEMVRTRSYFPKNWSAGQDLWIFFLHTFIAVFTLFSDDYLLMHSWASTIFIIMGVLSCIYCSRKVAKNNSWLVSLPLLFCGISGEYSEIVFGQSAYLPPLIYLFFFISLYIDSVEENTFHVRSKSKFTLLLLLIAFIGLSGVRYIQVIGVPLLGTIVISYLTDHYNDSLKNFLKSSKAMIAVAVSIAIAVVVGFLGFHKLSSRVNFSMGAAAINYGDWNIFERITTFINDFFLLFGLTYNIPFISFKGIINIIKVVVGILIFIVYPILQIKKFKKEKKSMQLFIIFSLLHITEIIILSFFTFFNPNGISRYLFTTEYLLLFLSGHYIYKYVIKGGADFAKIISVCFVVVYTACCSVPKFTSFIKYDEKIANERVLTDYLKSKGLSYGYATYWNAAKNTVLSNGEVEINSINIYDRVFPYYWLNSMDRYEANSGECFLMLTNEENQSFINSKSYYEFGDPVYIEQYNGFWIYVYDYNIGHDEFKGKSTLKNTIEELIIQYPSDSVYYYDILSGNYSPIDDMAYYTDAAMILDNNGNGEILVTNGNIYETDKTGFFADNFEQIGSFGENFIYYSNRNIIDFSTGLPVGEENISIDYPYTNGVINNCKYTEGKWITTGENGYAFYGPYAQTYEGEYKISLFYNYIDFDPKETDRFDICLNTGSEIAGYADLSPQKDCAEITVKFANDEVFEYRLDIASGSTIEIKYIQMEKIA